MNDFWYRAEKPGGLQIIDIDPPESDYIISWIETKYNSTWVDVAVYGNYAYVASDYGGLQVIKLW